MEKMQSYTMHLQKKVKSGLDPGFEAAILTILKHISVSFTCIVKSVW